MTLIPSGWNRGGRQLRTRRAAAAGFAVAILPAALALAGSPAATSAQHSAASRACPWLDQSLPVSKRVSMLLARMTLGFAVNAIENRGGNAELVHKIYSPRRTRRTRSQEDLGYFSVISVPLWWTIPSDSPGCP